jgi:hypothetical protein
MCRRYRIQLAATGHEVLLLLYVYSYFYILKQQVTANGLRCSWIFMPCSLMIKWFSLFTVIPILHSFLFKESSNPCCYDETGQILYPLNMR